MEGGQPPVTRTPAPAAKPVTSAPPARTPPPVAKPAGATQAMAWDLINKNGAGMKPEELEAAWFKLVDATGMDQAEMTPEGWQQVMDAIHAASKDGTLMPF